MMDILFQNATSIGNLAPIQALIAGVINIVLTIFGWLFWLDFALLMVHFIESRIHPTPSGRGSALGEFIGRARGMLFGYLGVYIAIYIAVTVLNILGAGLNPATIFYDFFIAPIIHGFAIVK